MPIKIPDRLPARTVLEGEGLILMGEATAVRQDIRPLRIGLLNLMPDKSGTETQFARLLGASPLQVELILVQLENHIPRHTAASHMAAFYRPWDVVSRERFDGFIVTGAPVERLEFEEIRYWDELRRIFDWTQTHVHSVLTICWGAQAAVHHFHQMPKHVLPEKYSGIFSHRNQAPNSPYLRGLSDEIEIPVSRWSEVRREDLPSTGQLRVLLDSDSVGLCLLEDVDRRALHMFNHFEYETMTLAEEYTRDIRRGVSAHLPQNYFPNDDPSRVPVNRWRSHATMFFSAWIDQIYQTAPFDLHQIGSLEV